MKADELLRFDGLVIEKLKELLAAHRSIFEASDRREVLKAASEADNPEMNELVFALRRIEKGTYGQCVICRHEISSDMLEKNLTARLCLSCQNAMQEKIDYTK